MATPPLQTSAGPLQIGPGGEDRRQTWDEYFLSLAGAASSRSTCVRRKVGAVIVRERHIVSTGYNGGPSGYPHCDEGGCPRAQTDAQMGSGYDGCVAIHAEANALLFCGPQDRRNATIYCTDLPCFGCAKLIANSGVEEVVASGGRYDGWDRVRDFLLDAGVRVRLLDGLEGLPSLDLRAG